MHPNSKEKCPSRSRIVSDTDYITHLRTINLKLNMLVNILCPFTCYSAVETFIWKKENIFYKTENVFLSFFKNRRTQLAAFVI